MTVTDQSGDGIAGVLVRFAITAGGGDIEDASSVTDATASRRVGSWTLGSAGGTNRLSATAQGDGIANNPITFTATATVAPSEPDRLVFLVQPSRTEEEDRIEPAVQVAVVDSRGDVVPDRQVRGASSSCKAVRTTRGCAATCDERRVDGIADIQRSSRGS